MYVDLSVTCTAAVAITILHAAEVQNGNIAKS